MQIPAAVAYMARANPDTACPYCGCLPVDDSGTCPANACPCGGMVTSSPVARERARRWRAGERPWRSSVILLVILLAVALRKQYPPGSEPARLYPGTNEKTGRAQDGRPETARVYPPGQELAHAGNSGLAIEKER